MDMVSVDKLREVFDPFWALGIPDADFAWEKVEPFAEFKPGYKDGDRDDAYHMGRIRYFMDQFIAQKEVDPIDIDCSWNRHAPVGPSLIDGHHRLCGAIIANIKEIPAELGGPVDMIEWLKGTGPKPEWMS